MKAVLVLVLLIIKIVFLPFTLLDWLVFKWPKERAAKKWRKTAKMGDRGYFINLFGKPTYFTIKEIDRRRTEPYWIESKSYASTMTRTTDLSGCYPAE